MFNKLQSSKYQFAVPLDANTLISEEEFNQIVPKPAKKYPFELDTFQKQAIIHIEKGENVFVAAHTSAGKTVVAEYAIAKSFFNKTKVIYTSPIKALSNQKFRDLRIEFEDVGIITGDVQLNPEASCLVVTTEILLQMLYASSDSINNLEFVIFDECHYVNDSKRGHVWEEVFILLPSSVKLVLLSATVPNVIEFSDWLGRTRQRKIYVISTNKRPVPLKHSFYLGRDGKTQNQQLLILEGDGQINRTNHEMAVELMNQRKAKFGFIKRTSQTERNIYLNLIRHLEKNNKLPVICFTLSRKKCDQNLDMLLSIKEENSTLTTKKECYYIKRFIYKHLKSLKKSDYQLEQVKRVSTMLTRGFGVHHSGVLPILKELTEILFSSGLVKVLYATETFAMGVNMPARSVVFDSLNKHDGMVNRFLKPAEYIQMAGRAGRRGKDTEGNVIILCKYDVPSLVELNLVLKGSAQLLESQFRLTYHMILNMLKTQTASIKKFLRCSYREHNKVLSSSSVETSIQELCTKMNELDELNCENCSKDIDSWHSNLIVCDNLKKELISFIIMRACDKKLMLPGRLLVFKNKEQIVQSCLLLKLIKKGNSISELIVLCQTDQTAEMRTVPIEEFYCILNKHIKGIKAQDIIQENESRTMKNKFCTKEAIEKMDIPFHGIDLLKWITSNFITHEKLGKIDPDLLFSLQDYEAKFKQLTNSIFNCLKCEQFSSHYQLFRKRFDLQENLSQLDYKRSDESLELLPEYNQRIAILKEFNFLDEHLVLLPKGHIASCLSECELIITEIVFENLLGNLSDEAIPAILSCFIFDSKRFEQNTSTKYIQEIEELDQILRKFVDICVKFGKAEKCFGIEASESHYLDQLNFDPVRAVYEWAKGNDFSDIIKYTTLQEGIMVRCIQRVDELMKNISIAARNMELVDFQAKLERSSKLIRRDIVFMPSLYTGKELIQIKNQETEMDDDTNNDNSPVESFEELNDYFNYNFNNESDAEEANEEQYNSNFI